MKSNNIKISSCGIFENYVIMYCIFTQGSYNFIPDDQNYQTVIVSCQPPAHQASAEDGAPAQASNTV